MKKQIDWPVALFLILNPIFGITLFFIYIYFFDTSWIMWISFLIFAAVTNLSITAGYHRLFAHRSYETTGLMKFLLVLFGSSAFQGSALKWASDHRRHHSHIDTEKDPYSIKKGFWYAHIGWLFFKDSVDLEIKAPDLEKDRLLQHQNKYYVWWAIATGFVLPTLIGLAFGAPLGGLIILGSLRIFVTQQSTFFVNSLCHTLGEQTYSKEISARDSFIVAVLTHGEGYHNFHHQFQIDYRNGIKWYHWDPTKWTIQIMKIFGMAKKLRTIPPQEILKARLNAEAKWLETKGISVEKVEALKVKILEAQIKVKKFKEEYALRKEDWKNSSKEKWNEIQIQVAELKLNIQKAKSDFNFALKEWQLVTQQFA
ncbi:MAG: fatty acid desaturase [Bdellovibrionaceae bacterium]|nr:fatty acid desaturase [Pseudobdellovibrionaceae bacterium]